LWGVLTTWLAVAFGIVALLATATGAQVLASWELYVAMLILFVYISAMFVKGRLALRTYAVADADVARSALRRRKLAATCVQYGSLLLLMVCAIVAYARPGLQGDALRRTVPITTVINAIITFFASFWLSRLVITDLLVDLLVDVYGRGDKGASADADADTAAHNNLRHSVTAFVLSPSAAALERRHIAAVERVEQKAGRGGAARRSKPVSTRVGGGGSDSGGADATDVALIDVVDGDE